MSFYRYRQNNSGGIWTEPAINVIVEAGSADEANDRAETLGVYFGGAGDCSCCGNRWSTAWENESTEEPCVYTPGDLQECSGSRVFGLSKDSDIPNIIVLYADNRKEVWKDGELKSV